MISKLFQCSWVDFVETCRIENLGLYRLRRLKYKARFPTNVPVPGVKQGSSNVLALPASLSLIKLHK